MACFLRGLLLLLRKKMKQKGKLTRHIPLKIREYVFNNPDYTVLYYLPEDHYIGVARNKNLWRRMYQHRSNGNYTHNVEILGWYERRVDAHLVETMFHMRGYNGFRELVRS